MYRLWHTLTWKLNSDKASSNVTMFSRLGAEYAKPDPLTGEKKYSFTDEEFQIKVNGEDAEPLYKFLQEQKGFAGWAMNHKIAPILDDMLSKADPDYKQKPDIKWNFTKFLINKRGQVVARFEPTESIENIAKQIEELLK